MIQFKTDYINITPNEPCRLTGMSENEVSDGIYNDLELNLVMIQDEIDKMLIFSIDSLFFTKDLIDYIKSEVRKYDYDFNDNNLIFVASHTHYAPSLEVHRHALGKRDESYFNFLKNQLKKFLLEFFKDKKFEDLYRIELNTLETSKITANRRRKVRVVKDLFRLFVSMEPNLKGFKNEEFKIIKFFNQTDQTPNLVLWSFPCHLTNLHVNNLVSSEFVGLLREDLRNKMSKQNLTVIYFPGFAGDIRAYPPKRSLIKRKLRDIFRLSYPVDYYRFVNEKEYFCWYQSLNKQFWKAWESNSIFKHTIENRIELKKIQFPISELEIRSKCVDEIIFRKIKISNLFSILTISAEPVSSYYNRINLFKKDEFVIYTGYTDEVFGYLPTNECIKEGGYESEGYFKNFLVSGRFLNQLEEKVLDVITKLD